MCVHRVTKVPLFTDHFIEKYDPFFPFTDPTSRIVALFTDYFIEKNDPFPPFTNPAFRQYPYSLTLLTPKQYLLLSC